MCKYSSRWLLHCPQQNIHTHTHTHLPGARQRPAGDRKPSPCPHVLIHHGSAHCCESGPPVFNRSPTSTLLINLPEREWRIHGREHVRHHKDKSLLFAYTPVSVNKQGKKLSLATLDFFFSGKPLQIRILTLLFWTVFFAAFNILCQWFMWADQSGKKKRSIQAWEMRSAVSCHMFNTLNLSFSSFMTPDTSSQRLEPVQIKSRLNIIICLLWSKMTSFRHLKLTASLPHGWCRHHQSVGIVLW